jgi:DNA repair protein RecO (recombination protein O)
MTYKTLGIIIKRTNLGEADRIITLFSENSGKLKAIAKGIRKIKSRLSGNVELFCLTNFTIAEGRNLDIITGAQIEKCYFNIRNDLKLTQRAYYFAELIDKLTEINDPHPEIFSILDKVLENLNNIDSDLLIPYFEWNIVTEIGYFPELQNCLNCGRKISENEKIYFNVSRGGIVCKNCEKSDMIITSDTIKLLRLFLKHNILSLQKIKLDLKTKNEIKKITRIYLNSKSEKEFKTQRFLK